MVIKTSIIFHLLDKKGRVCIRFTDLSSKFIRRPFYPPSVWRTISGKSGCWEEE